MKDIIFRGKEIKTGEWIFGSYSKIKATGLTDARTTIDNDEFLHDVSPETVGQYTGLKDKNGVKIFEGDIILSNGEKNRYEVKIGEFSPFLFNAFLKEMELTADYKIIGVYAKSLDNKDIVGEECFIPIPNKIEVISNIHDNPELLEVPRGVNGVSKDGKRIRKNLYGGVGMKYSS
jgi:uncharacterized phage protein (TIGR01671 family)